MNLTLTRREYRSDGIFSELRDESGELVAVTLEHAYPTDGAFQPKIPLGKFICIRGHHKLDDTPDGFETFEITGVEGHINLLFHWGNFNRDSDGCVLLGTQTSQNGPNGSQMILHSRVAFQKFMDLQNGLNQFELSVVG